jgi:hypothetical protein
VGIRVDTEFIFPNMKAALAQNAMEEDDREDTDVDGEEKDAPADSFDEFVGSDIDAELER